MNFSNDPGSICQGLDELTSIHKQIQSDLSKYRCSRCDRFGVVSGVHDYFGIIYKCSCQAVFWVINPETGDRIEEVKP
ncbi:hypothetical protein [Aliterella atlantica]|uniref:Uncharacterized protein n=1 Tax=Aliterella atlantica CENA595 TaxID=1618023 RepID=A0A0D8ZQL1_9CYAN|nr:hypothetical protein [Aliterella atlantica]KJH69501.1 hypothetical protein UH38_23380 [Aliterella atlantica CENA595]